MNVSFDGSLSESFSFSAAANTTTTAHAVYELSAALLPGIELRVLSFDATEGLSELFAFEIVFVSEFDPAALEAALIARPVTFTMNLGGEASRVVQGIAASLQVEGQRQSEQRNQYRVRLVPKMWLLRRRKTSRIFQDKTLVEVVDLVLGEWGIERRWSVTREFPARAYCVQYQETDHDFVTRLLAEEGLFFYFELPSALLSGVGGSLSASIGAAAGVLGATMEGQVGASLSEAATETLVLCDGAGSYPAIASTTLQTLVDDAVEVGVSALSRAIGGGAGSLIASLLRPPAPGVPFRDVAGMRAAAECVSRLELSRTLRSQAVFLRDYDFEHPPLQLNAKARVDLTGALAGAANATLSEALAGGHLSLATTTGALAGAARAAASSFDGRLEVYDHHGEYEETDVTTDRAKTELEQYRADAVLARGESTCRRFAPGYRFLLQGHAVAELDREYAVTKITHRGRVPEVAAADADAGAVYSNSFECVPADVPFRPRRPKRRLQQVMESAVVVGPIGEEIHTDEYGRVKVQFYWDRDGAYNERSSCWLRVLHAWAGASWGFQFVPRVGMEVLVSFLGGDEDRPVVLGCVYNKTHPTPHRLPFSKTRSGIRTQSTPGGMGYNEIAFEDRAGGEELFLRAQKDMRELVQNDHLAVIGANDSTCVGGDQKLEVQGNQSVAVEKDQTLTLGGDHRATIRGNVNQLVGKDLHVAVIGDARWTTDGSMREEVAGDVMRQVRGDATTVVGGESSCASLLHVGGSSRFTSTGFTEISSSTEVVIRCGKSVLRLTPDAIELVAPEIRIRAPGSGLRVTEGQMELRATNGGVFSAETITLKSAAAQIALTDAALVQAAQINLATEAPSADEGPESAEKPTHIELSDHEGNPIPYQHYTVTSSSGTRVGGMVGRDGKDKLFIKDGNEVLFPELTAAESA